MITLWVKIKEQRTLALHNVYHEQQLFSLFYNRHTTMCTMCCLEIRETKGFPQPLNGGVRGSSQIEVEKKNPRDE